MDRRRQAAAEALLRGMLRVASSAEAGKILQKAGQEVRAMGVGVLT